MVTGDDAGRSRAIASCLSVHDVSARAVCSSDLLEPVRIGRPRVVVCQPGSTGLALFHALRDATDPPVIVVLSEAPWSRDEVYCDGRLLVAVIRMPVEMLFLASFIKAVLNATVRFDEGRAPPAACAPSGSRPKNQARLRIVH